jgi:hypothetical protein
MKRRHIIILEIVVSSTLAKVETFQCSRMQQKNMIHPLTFVPHRPGLETDWLVGHEIG